MNIFLSHIWFILGTLVLGVIIGWNTYPIYKRMVSKFFSRKED